MLADVDVVNLETIVDVETTVVVVLLLSGLFYYYAYAVETAASAAVVAAAAVAVVAVSVETLAYGLSSCYSAVVAMDSAKQNQAHKKLPQ